jgi:hypothetical protein
MTKLIKLRLVTTGEMSDGIVLLVAQSLRCAPAADAAARTVRW